MQPNRVELDVAVPRAQQEEVLKNLHWIDPALESIAFARDDDRALCCTYRGGEVPPRVRDQLKAVADRIARSVTTLPVRVAYESRVTSVPGCRSPYEALCERKWVVPVGQGFHVYGGLMNELYQALDAEFRMQALALGAKEYKFPAIIDLKALARSGYLDSFPHNANFVAHLPEHAEAIQAFQNRLRAGGECCPAGAAMAPVETALSPTVCYHFYYAIENTTLSTDPTAATAVSPCYRFEGRAMAGLRRLREFNMREIIFLGREDRVRKCRDKLIDLQIRMLELCGLQSRIRGASDPFFLDSNAEKRVFQIGFDLKQEVVAYLPEDGDWLAIGSVNYHQDFFGTRFGIRLKSGQPAHSCCLGFGLDRWCMAIFAQHGLEPQVWPASLRELLEARASDLENASAVGGGRR